MGRRLIVLTVFLLGAAVSISACSQAGSSGQAGPVQTQTTGYGSDYAPMGQGDHHR